MHSCAHHDDKSIPFLASNFCFSFPGCITVAAICIDMSLELKSQQTLLCSNNNYNNNS